MPGRLVLVSTHESDQKTLKALAERCKFEFKILKSLKNSQEIDKILNALDHIFIDAGIADCVIDQYGSLAPVGIRTL